MKQDAIQISKEKLNGRIYTPEFIVNNILNLSGYYGDAILKKHVIDNSCGDGAFLVAIVDLYCKEFLKLNSDLSILATELATYVHGIEIDEKECKKCINNLNLIANKYKLNSVNWDICCCDALTQDKYDGKMDYVLGNPPYVRVHNLGDTTENIKKFSFAQSGMTDLYIVFYELGLKMLNKNGVLGYITPSSFFNSLAGKQLRLHLKNNNLMDKIVDLKHFQAFAATTYTTIVILKNNREEKTTNYYQFENKNNFPYYIDTLSIDDYNISDCFYFAKKEELRELKNILTFKPKNEHFAVKNGFATLADNVFIGNFNFEELTIPIVKASTGKKTKCIFPYSNGKIIPYSAISQNEKLRVYLEENKASLLDRSIEKNSEWYAFGRSQGINDVYKCKYAINALIRTTSDLKLIKCDKGVGVYSGLYILTEVPEQDLTDILHSKNFETYIALLGKYKSGGYYTFSSKDLKNYLEYKYHEKFTNGATYEQSRVFAST